MPRPANANARVVWLGILFILSEITYLLVAWSGQSLHVEGVGNWSLLTILGLFAIVFALYLLALGIALRAVPSWRLVLLIAVGALSFRATLLNTDPIAEIDIYRYMWDGEVCLQGVSPFRYSPAQVGTIVAGTDVPPDLARLVRLREDSDELATILGRIHFAELPTIYPPVSQAVFAVASLATPAQASIRRRMITFKTAFVLFDVLTLIVVVALLYLTGRHPGWALAYGWCPLVIKEFANSGHLDAVAVFLATFALWLMLRGYSVPSGRAAANHRDRLGYWLLLSAGVVLGLAVGAKLYPVVLLPLLAVACLRRLGWRKTVFPLAAFAMTTGLVLWPMVPRARPVELRAFRFPTTTAELPPLPPPLIDATPRDPSESVRAFLSEWEMNDFIFLLSMENVRPTANLPRTDVAWFSLMPERWRAVIRDLTAALTGVEASRTPFFFTRAWTSGIFLIGACWLAWRVHRQHTADAFLEAAFLTIAWFWLILPTGNPWYWTWTIPLLPFARGKTWLAMSGLVLVYYARFWFTYHYPYGPVLGTSYNGALFFDFVVTWFEFGPWFVLLIYAALRRARLCSTGTSAVGLSQRS